MLILIVLVVPLHSHPTTVCIQNPQNAGLNDVVTRIKIKEILGL